MPAIGFGQTTEGALPVAQPTTSILGHRAARVNLDGTLESALRAAAPGGPGFVLATFANSALEDHLTNFVAHATRVRIPFLIGAVDESAFAKLSAEGTPSYRTPLALERYSLDGSNSHASGSWKKFAGMRTGEVRKIVELGYSVLHSDIDVIWLRNPSPFLMCMGEGVEEFAQGRRFECQPMLAADVAVSSDNMSPGKDTEGRAGYSAGGTFNTGLLFIRSTPKGLHFVREWNENVVRPPRGSRFSALTSDQQVFNHMMRKPNTWPGISAPKGATVMKGWDDQVLLGALPMALFMNGHGYFVQAAHARLGVVPMAVHATYSLDNHDGVAKRQRFKEAGIWRAHPADYYEGRFLALNASLPAEVQERIAHYKSRGEPPSNIEVHERALTAYVRELRDGLALARALGRTLVLPRWMCFCDRMWSGSDDIFHFGCMYPGSQDGNFVPFTCPMDHVLSPAAWARAGIKYRDAVFVEEGDFARRGALADLAVIDRVDYESSPAASRPAAVLPTGLSDAEAKALLQPLAAVPVLRLPHARGLLCRIEDAAEADALNALISSLLRVPQWCAKCFQPCEKELARWLSQESIREGAAWGGNSFCMRSPIVPQYRTGQCVSNLEVSRSA